MAKQTRQNFLGILALFIFALTIYGMVRLHVLTPTTRAEDLASEQSNIDGSDHYLYAAVYSTKNGLSSTLGLNNTLNHDMTARVTLFNKHGQSLTTPEMNITLGPHKNHGFDIADW